MTHTRFTIALLLQSFGVLRKTKRLADASFEMHLMQDGEELLGAFCWQNTEDIEELSMEYWTLRRIEREEQALIEKLKKAEETLKGAQIKRADLVDQSKNIGQELVQSREDLFELVEKLNIEREKMMAEAATIKRKFSALKIKQNVLKEEGSVDKEKVDKCSADLLSLKKRFAESKITIAETTSKIKIKELKLNRLQTEIEKKMQGSKDKSTESFALISKANREITDHRSELGILNEEQAKAYREVGRFLNLNADRGDCRKATKNHRGLLEQTRLLYRSVRWNRRLAEKAGS